MMRDIILRAGESFDDTELCMDLVDFCIGDVRSEITGIIV